MQQSTSFGNDSAPKCPLLTTANGAPIGIQHALTAGPRGPVLMQDVALWEQMQHFNRERIPKRVVHAKRSGAFATFTVTGDIAEWTRAKIFEKVGKKTELFMRFSTVAGERVAGSFVPLESIRPQGVAGKVDVVCGHAIASHRSEQPSDPCEPTALPGDNYIRDGAPRRCDELWICPELLAEHDRLCAEA